MNNWSPEQIETLRSMWGKGESSGQIAKAIGKTRNAVMGMVNRQGLIGLKGAGAVKAKAPESEIPAIVEPKAKETETVAALEENAPKKNIQITRNSTRVDLLKESMSDLYKDYVDEDQLEIIQILAAAVVFETTNHIKLAEILSIDEEITAKVRDDMFAAGLWTETTVGDVKRYEGKEGFMQFILEAMLYEDMVVHENGMWRIPDEVETPALKDVPKRLLETAI